MLAIIMSIVGWAGAVLLATAYTLLTTEKLSSKSTLYHLLNFAGAVCILINTTYKNALGPAALNVFWIGVSILGIRAALRSKNLVPTS